MKQIFSIIALGMMLITSQASAQNTTETIVTTGMGSTIESAIQGAARNALTQAVGQFVDTETQISKRTEIRDGVREITKDMSENVSATSNGTIQEVQILDQQSNDGIFTVEAAVTVRISDLERAMEGRLSVTSNVSNVFAQIAAANDQNFEDKVKVFKEKFLDEIISTNYMNVSVGDPQTFQSYLAANRVDELEGNAKGYMSLLQGKFSGIVDALTEQYARESLTLLVVPIDIGFTDSAIASWKATIAELSSDKVVLPWASDGSALFGERGMLGSWEKQIQNSLAPGALPVCFVKLNAGATCHIVSGFGSAALKENFDPYFEYWVLKKRPTSGTTIQKTPIMGHEFTLSVNDANGYPVSIGNLVGPSEDHEFIRHLRGLSSANSKFGFQGRLPSDAFPMTPYSGLVHGSFVYPGGYALNQPIIYIIESRRIHAGLMLSSDKLSRASAVDLEIEDGVIWDACRINENIGWINKNRRYFSRASDSAYYLCR